MWQWSRHDWNPVRSLGARKSIPDLPRDPLSGLIEGRVSEFVRLPARLIIEEVLEAKRETR